MAESFIQIDIRNDLYRSFSIPSAVDPEGDLLFSLLVDILEFWKDQIT